MKPIWSIKVCQYVTVPVIFLLLLTLSCAQNSKQEKSEHKKVLLSNFTIPENYSLSYKDHYYPEGEQAGWNDSIYVFKKGKSEIAVTVKYFSKKVVPEKIDKRMHSFSQGLMIDNGSFKIRNRRLDNENYIWYINYTFGSENSFMYNFYLERKTLKYCIVIKSFDNQLTAKEIDFLYNEVCDFEG